MLNVLGGGSGSAAKHKLSMQKALAFLSQNYKRNNNTEVKVTGKLITPPNLQHLVFFINISSNFIQNRF